MPERNTGMVIETVRSGFLGRPVIYYLWNGNKMIAHSEDLVTWKFTTNFDKISVDYHQASAKVTLQ